MAQSLQYLCVYGKSQAWHLFQCKESQFTDFIRLGCQVAHIVIDHAGPICYYYVRIAVFSIDAQQIVQANIQVRFLFDLADSRFLDLFTTIYVTAYEAPQAFTWINVAPPKQKSALVLYHDHGYQLRFKK